MPRNSEARKKTAEAAIASAQASIYAREARETNIQHECAVKFGAAFIEQIRLVNPSAWREWSWEQRRQVLLAEKERLEGVEI